jgi:hypothetical protein
MSSSNSVHSENEIRKSALKHISSPTILSIIDDIKRMQLRLKHPSVKALGFASQNQQMQDEFPSLAKYDHIFKMVFDGNMETVVRALYLKDQQDRGLIKEEELASKLESAYFSEVERK